MKGKALVLITLLAGVGVANAAVRGDNNIARNASTQSRTRTTSERVTRAASQSVISRTTPARSTTQRATVSSRTARTATQPATIRQTKSVSTTRSANVSRATTKQSPPSARAGTITTTGGTNLGTGYNTCRDAYFTCMDQFCGTADDTYRRCICSSKLTEIQSRERALSQAETQLQDFKNLNLAVIDKTAGEVGAMLSATAGEIAQSNAKDKSDSAKQLSGISDVLSKTKTQSLSTQGTLDIAGDINAIWSTTDLTGGTNISNLTGEALYNAVHAQCSEMISDACPDAATKTMVVSAYGMYIENDCSLMINGLDKKLTAANATIRNTEYEMGDLRLENYNAHNSTSINDCIAQVRSDITSNMACGTDYVHCLDVTGRYLNYETGEPIYTAKFFELDSLTSLSGDLLTNQANRMTLAKLQDMRNFAERGLDTCRDISDDVWDEFLRQAITEIHQGQQARIRQVKDECLDVLNKCYDEQNQQLKDFTNTDETLLLGSRLELSEKMCQEKLDACSNVYGGGTDGLDALLIAMGDIIDQQIAQQCVSVLQNYLQDLCTPPSNDTLHAYPYGCRIYEPGGYTSYKTYADKLTAVKNTSNKAFQCDAVKIYVSCEDGYYLSNTKCLPCPKDDTSCNKGSIQNTIYYKLTQYAKQTCVRPSKSDSDEVLPATVLQDVNTVMDKFKSDMATELAKECERQDGKWSSYTQTKNDTNAATNLAKFYSTTSANEKWGLCTVTSGIPCIPDVNENAINGMYKDGKCVPTICNTGYVLTKQDKCEELYSKCSEDIDTCCKDMPQQQKLGDATAKSGTSDLITNPQIPVIKQRYTRGCKWDSTGKCACLCDDKNNSIPQLEQWTDNNAQYEGYRCPIIYLQFQQSDLSK